MKHIIYLGLGSNLGDRKANLEAAIAALPPAVQPTDYSPIYETAPWGYEEQSDFLNQVIQAETDLEPAALLHYIKDVEQRVGRTPRFRYGPREIDVDILFYDDLHMESYGLEVPHPRIAERAFVLVPLADLAPDLYHPTLGKTVRQLLAEVDTSGISAWDVTGAAQNRRPELIAYWKAEEQKPFSGWDFSYLDGRMVEETEPWSYMDRAAELLRDADAALDMGTGGGERLLQLQPYWARRMVVTEDYEPNYELVKERLTPLGVRVEFARLDAGTRYPFADGEFDLVLNRHSGINPPEVARILAPGGTFLTQQIHGLWAHELLEFFGVPPEYPDATLAYYLPRLQAAGMEIVDYQDWSGKFTLSDVGALVYYLTAIPWTIPGFSVDTHLSTLFKLQDKVARGEKLEYSAKKYLIEARKT